MRRLSALDTSFLALDSPTTSGHVSLVITLAARPDLHELREVLDRWSRSSPLLRQRLVQVPLGLGRPYWETDPAFSPSQHLHRIAFDGGDEDLAAAVTLLARPRLPRDRPLWRLTMMDGHDTARTALVLQIHHAVADGLAILELVERLFHGSDVATPLPGLTLSPIRTLQRWAGLADLPVTAGRTAAAVAHSAVSTWTDRAVERMAGWADGEVSMSIPNLPLDVLGRGSTFNRSVGAARNLAFGDVSLDAARALKPRGATINDVVLAAVAGALRRWFEEAGELPQRPLQAAVPIAHRASTGGGNQLGLISAGLPVHLPDVDARLTAVSRTMTAAKRNHATGDASIETAVRWAVPGLATPAMRIAQRLRLANVLRLPYEVMVSNIPGWPEERTLAGVPVTGLYPVGAIADGLGLNITVQSYIDRLCYGVVSTPAMLPDPWRLLDLIRAEHEQLAVLPG